MMIYLLISPLFLDSFFGLVGVHRSQVLPLIVLEPSKGRLQDVDHVFEGSNLVFSGTSLLQVCLEQSKALHLILVNLFCSLLKVPDGHDLQFVSD